jgi:serine/threonine protein kinase
MLFFGRYVAPEILAEIGKNSTGLRMRTTPRDDVNCLGYSIEVDCWATGIILYILLCGYPPFKTADRNQEELFQLIQRGKFIYEPEYWSSISSSMKQLSRAIDARIIEFQVPKI